MLLQQQQVDEAWICDFLQNKAKELYGEELHNLVPYQLQHILAELISHFITTNWEESLRDQGTNRTVHYLSIEFLPGRLELDALNSLGLYQMVQAVLDDENIDIHDVDENHDPALGNGGLGRLAACYLDSGASLRKFVNGMGLFYKFGLFQQYFDNENQQREEPDDWVNDGNYLIHPKNDWAFEMALPGTSVMAVPYLMPVIGYSDTGKPEDAHINYLTLWKAEPIPGVTSPLAEKISDYLYPNDSTHEGKKLRLLQQLFFARVTIHHLLRLHMEKYGTLDNFHEYNFFQMNDTHPVLCCLEFIRALEERGYTFEQAFDMAHKCFAYTNHTVMSEALEKWDMFMFKDMMPDIYKVIENLNQKLIDELIGDDRFCFKKVRKGRVHREPHWRKHIDAYELIKNGEVRMANIACFVACKINGVAKLHTDILKNSVLKIWYDIYPERVLNITNGITPRRWISLANPYLRDFLNERLGTGWVTNLGMLEQLKPLQNDMPTLAAFADVKLWNKKGLADKIWNEEQISIDPNSMFDIQVKRFHAYKRQLMNALRILYLFDKIKAGQLPDFYPTTFIFGGKAAASYDFAKNVIQFINDLADMVNNDPVVSQKMTVVLVTDFNVSYSEYIYPAADISEQISTAGKEASGTGNMKLSLNGAVTCGTLDGANVEIVAAAGEEHNYLFGATVDELAAYKETGSYDHGRFLQQHPELKHLLKYLKGEIPGLAHVQWNLSNELEHVDTFMVMHDLVSYIEISLMANRDYAEERRTGDHSHFTRKQFINMCSTSHFSSDRAVLEYCENIWNI